MNENQLVLKDTFLGKITGKNGWYKRHFNI